MTASTTEQERAEFEAWARSRYPSIDLTRDGDDYSKALAKDYWSLWQAARRAPAVPVPQEPTSKQVVLGAGALLGQPENTADNRHPDWHSAVAKARSVYLAMLAAAPQPPEAENHVSMDKMQANIMKMCYPLGKATVKQSLTVQLDDTNVVDIAQVVDFNNAAPQPPEADHIPDAGKMVAVPVPQGFKLAPTVPTPEMIEAAAEAYMPFGDMGIAVQMALNAAPQPPEATVKDSLTVEAAPVQMPEPDGYIMDSLPNGRLEYKRGPLSQMDSICNSTMPVYEYGTVRQLLAAHGIQEQST